MRNLVKFKQWKKINGKSTTAKNRTIRIFTILYGRTISGFMQGSSDNP
jgi:hypothetical protein